MSAMKKKLNKNVKTCSRWKWSSPSQLSVESQPVLQKKIVSLFFIFFFMCKRRVSAFFHFLFYVQKKIVSLFCIFVHICRMLLGNVPLHCARRSIGAVSLRISECHHLPFFMCAKCFFWKVFVTTSSYFSLTKNSNFQQQQKILNSFTIKIQSRISL